MSTSIPTFLPSTGQTDEDIRAIIEVGKVLHIPLMSPPALYDPDYKVVTTSGHLMPVIIISILISCSMVGLRLVSTHKNGRTSSRMFMYLEDWLILIGLILLLGLAGFAFAGVYRWQWGWKSSDLHFANWVFNYKAFYIWFILNLWASCIVRASLILTVRRLYSPMKTRMLVVCDAFLCLKVILAIGGTLGLTFSCGANTDIMNIYKFSASCNGYIFSITVCVVAIIVDLAIIVLPMPLISMLRNITKRKKIEVGIIFSLGFLAVGASCARLAEMIRFMQPIDKNYFCTYIALACLLELSMALCTSCIPSARVLFERLYAPDSLFSVKAYIRRRPSVHDYAAKICRLRKPSAGTGGTVYSYEFDTDGKFDPTDLEAPPAAVLAGEAHLVAHSEKEGKRRSRPVSGGIFDPRACDLAVPETPALASGSKSDSHLANATKIPRGLTYPSAKAWMSYREDEDDDGDDDIQEFEVFHVPMPSDSFFPYGTPLSPRPTTRSSC